LPEANGIRSVGTARFIAFLKIYRRKITPMDISIGCIAAEKLAIVIIGAPHRC